MELATIPTYADILSQLRHTWNSVQTEHTLRVMLIDGASGMKKSSLVYHFLRETHAPYLVGRGSGVPEPYLPIRMAYESLLDLEPLREQLGKPRDDVPEAWQIAFTTIAEALRLLQPPPNSKWESLKPWQTTTLVPPKFGESGDGDSSERPRPISLPELFTFALGDLAAIQPLVLFIDNLDISDASTIEAFSRTILPALNKHPIFFLVTFDQSRSAAGSDFHGFLDTVMQLQKNAKEFLDDVTLLPKQTHVTLSPFQEADLSSVFSADLDPYLQALSDDQRSPFLHQLHRLSGGNFSRIYDVLNILRQTDPTERLATLKGFKDFNALISANIKRLSDNERSVLEIAACQGFYFCLPAIAEAAGLPDKEVEAVLASLGERTNLWIKEEPPLSLGTRSIAWYRFLGHQHHELILQQIPQDIRLTHHRAIARALETLYQDQKHAIAALLVDQFEQGGRRFEAAEYAALVAEQANAHGDGDQAQRYAQKGLDLLQDIKPSITQVKNLRCRLFIQQGRAMHDTEQGNLAQDVLRSAYDLAGELNDHTLLAEAGNALAQVLFGENQWDEAIDLIKDSLHVALQQQNWTAIAEGMENLRERAYKIGQKEQQEFFAYSDQLIERLKNAPSAQARVTIAELFEDKGWLHHKRSENDEALACFKQAFQVLENIGKRELYPDIYHKLSYWSAIVNRTIGNYEQALQEIEYAIKWADISRKRRNQALARYQKAKILRCTGQIEAGEQEVHTALHVVERSTDLVLVGEIENDSALFYEIIGRTQLAKKMYYQAYKRRVLANNFEKIQTPLGNFACIERELGFFQQAETINRQLLQDSILQGNKSFQSLSLNRLGEIFRIRNQLSDTEKRHVEALNLCNEIHNIDRKAMTLCYLGKVYLVMYEIDQAEKVLLESDALYAQKPGYYQNRTTLLLGRLNLCQNNPLQAETNLQEAIHNLENIRDLLWAGVCFLNLGLTFLYEKETEKALSKAQQAFTTLQKTESWRASEAHHLLARCYLALGDATQAQAEIDLAKSDFMRLKLFHRVHQAENTEFLIEDALETGAIKPFDLDELRQDFNHLGI